MISSSSKFISLFSIPYFVSFLDIVSDPGFIAVKFLLKHMSHFAYACKTERQNGISRLISELLRTLDSSLRDRLFVLQNEVF